MPGGQPFSMALITNFLVFCKEVLYVAHQV